MATVELVVLSSSPQAPSRYRSGFQRSLSPPDIYSIGGTTSPKRIRTTPPVNPRAAAIPEGASSGFRSASVLVKETGLGFDLSRYQCQDEDSSKGQSSRAEEKPSEPELEPVKRPKTKKKDIETDRAEAKPKPARKKKEKPIAPAPDIVDGGGEVAQDGIYEPKPKKVAKPRQKKVTSAVAAADDIVGGEVAQNGTDEPPLKKVAKPRQKKAKADTQTQIKDAKMTKPRGSTTVKNGGIKKSKASKSDLASNANGAKDVVASLEPAAGLPQVVPANAEVVFIMPPAMKRRDVWTPPRETRQSVTEPQEPDRDDVSAIMPLDTVPLVPAPMALSDLRGHFGYNEQTSRPEAAMNATKMPEVALGKRKRIEVVDVTAEAKKPDTAVVKQVKAQPKSARTITSIAMAHYQSPEKARSAPPTVVDIFFAPPKLMETDNTTSKPAEDVETDKAPKKSAMKQKADGAPQRKRKSVKVVKPPPPPAPKLLSPATALRKTARQEMFFGTSSQIVSEEPIAVITEIRQVIDISMDEPASRANGGSLDSRTRLRNVAASSLWAAAARDEESLMLDPELPTERLENRYPAKLLGLQQQSSDSFVDIEALDAHSPKQAANAIGENLMISGPVAQKINEEGALKDDAACLTLSSASAFKPSLLFIQPPKALNSSTPKATNVLQPLDVNTLPMPPTARRDRSPAKKTDATKAVSGGKLATSNAPPKKKLPGKAPTTDADPPALPKARKPRAKKPKPNVEANQAEAVPKPRSKSISKSTRKTDDIEDSEPEPASSPPRRRSTRPASELELSPASLKRASDEAKADKAAERAAAKAAETAAEEAILFPQITRAVKSEPRTTDPRQPSWYEKMLMYDPIVLEDFTRWLNGGALKALGGRVEEEEMVGGRETEKIKVVEAVTVQKWCDENSVCSLWKESLWGGTRKRY